MKKRVMALLVSFFLLTAFPSYCIHSYSPAAFAEESPAEEAPSEENTPQENTSEKKDKKSKKKKNKNKFKVTIKSGVGSVFAGEGDIPLKITIKNGTAPYTLTVKVNGEAYETLTVTEPSTQTVKYSPSKGGDFTFKAVVKDSNGNKVTAKVTVPVAIRDREYESTWKKTMAGVRLTGDWRADLIAIASTQIGYEESKTDFIVDDSGKKQGYTRYGEWYGSTYADWCGMFISFCLAHAEIAPGQFPREANPSKWKGKLQWMGSYVDDEDSYIPCAGDLIFFNYKEKNAPEHMAIIELVTENNIYTIEGNSEKKVRRCVYPRDDERIVGYSDTTLLMEKAEVKIPEDDHPDLPEIPQNGISALTRSDGVAIREDSTTRSIIIVPVPTVGTEVHVKYAIVSDGEIWYRVEYNGIEGYIKGELLFLQIKD